MVIPSARLGVARVQRGVALITALLVVALATVTAVAMASRQQLEVRRTANLLQGDQAYAYALAVESWARVVLLRDDVKIDTLKDDWATQLAPIAVPGGYVDGYVLDLQGRFNLYNLYKPDIQPDDPDVKYFQNLLRVLELNEQLVWAILDWIDADFETRFPDGAEDEVYLSATPPYRAANGPFQSVSELRLVKGIDAQVWNVLAPHLCALPYRTPLNVNTAAAPLLQALVTDFTAQDAAQLLEARGEDGFTDVGQFSQHELFAGRELLLEAGSLAVASQSFLVRSEVVVGAARSQVYSVLQRGERMSTLARTQGTW